MAELVLRKCTTTNAKDKGVQPDSEKYTVTFNYEFIEDKDYAQMYASVHHLPYSGKLSREKTFMD